MQNRNELSLQLVSLGETVCHRDRSGGDCGGRLPQVWVPAHC